MFYSPNISKEGESKFEPTTRRLGDDSKYNLKKTAPNRKSLTTTKYVLTNVIPRNTKPGR